MTTQTIEQAVEEFGNQFDELNMKPPKNSMPGLERELLKDFMRKALQAQRDAGGREATNKILNRIKTTQLSGGMVAMKNREAILEALTPPTK